MRQVRVKAYADCLLKLTGRSLLRWEWMSALDPVRRAYRTNSVRRIKAYEGRYNPGGIRPMGVEIEFTNRCNLSCIFCPNASHRRARGVMSPETLHVLACGIKDLEIADVTIGGFGEPLMDAGLPEKLDALRAGAGQAKISIVTNGVLLNGAIAERICRGRLADSIHVSIDAEAGGPYADIHGADAFDAVVSNLKQLNKLKLQHNLDKPAVHVRYKLVSAGIRRYLRFVSVFSDIADAIHPYANLFQWPGSSMPKNGVDLSRRGIKLACGNLWKSARVNWNGDVVLCCQDYEGSVVLGNIREQSLLDIWNGDRIAKYRAAHLRGDFDRLGICRECQINTHVINPW